MNDTLVFLMVVAFAASGYLLWYNWRSRSEEHVKLLSKTQVAENGEALRRKLLERYQRHARPHIAIEPFAAEAESIPLGSTRIGGLPDFPSNHAWPSDNQGRSLAFLAQINLKDLAQLGVESGLPETGSLLFFYDARQESWGFDPKDHDKFKVLFTGEDGPGLHRVNWPQDLPQEARFKSCSARMSPGKSLPDLQYEEVHADLGDEEIDAYAELAEDMSSGTQLLGHARVIQSIMEPECELVTNGLYCGDSSGYNDPRTAALIATSGHWVLLFQLDSEDEAGMMWGDVGRLYFWIKKDDLMNARFDRAWCIQQCY